MKTFPVLSVRNLKFELNVTHLYFTFLPCFCYILWSVCQSFTGSNIFPKFIFKISFICEISVIYPPLHGSRLCDPRTAFVRKNILSATKSFFLFLVWDGRSVLSWESNEYTWIPKYVLNFNLFNDKALQSFGMEFLQPRR